MVYPRLVLIAFPSALTQFHRSSLICRSGRNLITSPTTLRPGRSVSHSIPRLCFSRTSLIAGSMMHRLRFPKSLRQLLGASIAIMNSSMRGFHSPMLHRHYRRTVIAIDANNWQGAFSPVPEPRRKSDLDSAAQCAQRQTHLAPDSSAE